MNSSQRRKLKREYPYAIKLVAETRSGFRYLDHDYKVDDANKWCHKNTKGHRIDVSWDHTVFKFTTEKDAVFFALKWL